MLRQFIRRAALVAAAVVLGSTVPGCGIKGPLRPAPKAAPAAATSPPPPPIDNPATPPAMTSPALPPPTAPPERKP